MWEDEGERCEMFVANKPHVLSYGGIISHVAQVTMVEEPEEGLQFRNFKSGMPSGSHGTFNRCRVWNLTLCVARVNYNAFRMEECRMYNY